MTNKDKVLYISPKTPVENLSRILPTIPGQITHVSHVFIANLTDDQFREFCALDQDFKVNKKGANLIHDRIKQLGIAYDIDHKNNILKTTENGKETD